MKRLLTGVILLGCLLVSQVTSQTDVQRDSVISPHEYLQFDTTESLEFLFTLFPPFFIQHGMELKEFIRSDEFRQLRIQLGDANAIDAIFVRAMQLTKNNTGISLLYCATATLDHHIVSINIPVFLLAFPLSNESDEEFAQRVRNLPTQIYPDSPKNTYGDRDKLQHFFGSAFLTFAFESRGPAQRIGEAIELGEDAFIKGGANDDRDTRANILGQEFGLALMQNPFLYPSRFLLHAIAKASNSSSHNYMDTYNGFDSCR